MAVNRIKASIVCMIAMSVLVGCPEKEPIEYVAIHDLSGFWRVQQNVRSDCLVEAEITQDIVYVLIYSHGFGEICDLGGLGEEVLVDFSLSRRVDYSQTSGLKASDITITYPTLSAPIDVTLKETDSGWIVNVVSEDTLFEGFDQLKGEDLPADNIRF